MRPLATLTIALVAGVLAAAPSAAGAAPTVPGHTTVSLAPVQVEITSEVRPDRRRSSKEVLAIARRVPLVREVRAEHPRAYPAVFLKGPARWQVSWYAPYGGEVAQVIVEDWNGRVVEAWSGAQVAWTMARGYSGAFGEHVTRLYIWLPLCLIFLLPFARIRRFWSLSNVDLLALLSLSVSLAFFDHARIGASVPLAYPPLVYLLIRMLLRLRRAAPALDVRIRFGPRVLAAGVLFLLAFRVALNVTDGNVIDVGYAGVIGAARIVDGRAIYSSFPADNEHGDTYGPVDYEAYVPFEQIFGWSGRWDDLPAAHGAAVFFDLLCCALLFLIGRRLRGPTLGLALAWGWCSFPFTIYALESDSNDALVGALVLAAILAASYGTRPAAGAARGLAAGLAGLAKFAPLALLPVFATHGLRERSIGRTRALVAFGAGVLVAAALAAIPLIGHTSLSLLWQRTVAYQATRNAPFSIWGYWNLHWEQKLVAVGALALALTLAVVPRRGDLVGLCAAVAAILIGVELALEYWFYLYLPWFFGPALIAILAAGNRGATPVTVTASESARSQSPAAVLST